MHIIYFKIIIHLKHFQSGDEIYLMKFITKLYPWLVFLFFSSGKLYVHKIIQFSSVKLLSWFLFSYDSVAVGIIISQKKNHVYSTDFFIVYSLYRIREIYN